MVRTRPAGAHDKGQAPLLIDENAPAEGGRHLRKGLQPCPEAELCLRCFF